MNNESSCLEIICVNERRFLLKKSFSSSIIVNGFKTEYFYFPSKIGSFYLEHHESYSVGWSNFFITCDEINLHEKITNPATLETMMNKANKKVVFKSKSFSNLDDINCDTITSIINIVDKDDKLIKEYACVFFRTKEAEQKFDPKNIEIFLEKDVLGEEILEDIDFKKFAFKI